jgi:hypothetical protein
MGRDQTSVRMLDPSIAKARMRFLGQLAGNILAADIELSGNDQLAGSKSADLLRDVNHWMALIGGLRKLVRHEESLNVRLL